MNKEEQRSTQIMEIVDLSYEDCEKYSVSISGAIWADNKTAQDVVNLNDVEEWVYIWLKNDCNLDKWAYVNDLLPKGVNK